MREWAYAAFLAGTLVACMGAVTWSIIQERHKVRQHAETVAQMQNWTRELGNDLSLGQQNPWHGLAQTQAEAMLKALAKQEKWSKQDE